MGINFFGTMNQQMKVKKYKKTYNFNSLEINVCKLRLKSFLYKLFGRVV